METTNPDTRTVHEYLTSLRSGAPTPGGGSAAALAGAMGTALVAMVCRLTLKSASPELALASAVDRLDLLVNELSDSARQDESCYARYRAAVNLPKSTPDEKQVRSEAMQAALRVAAETPLLTASRALEAFQLAATVAESGTKHALSDVETAGYLLHAAIQGALVFVEVNADLVKDAEVAAGLRHRAELVRADASTAAVNLADMFSSRR